MDTTYSPDLSPDAAERIGASVAQQDPAGGEMVVMSPPVDPSDWRARGLCRRYSPEIFHPVKESKTLGEPTTGERQALAICRSCPVVRACLRWALAADEVQWGVFGGMTAVQRQAVRQHSQVHV